MTTSVALCTYNGADFLEDQLESILAQEIPVDEIVICDDGSTDDTQKIITRYKDYFPGLIQVYFNEENLGYFKNFEKALHLCTQNIIILCDQDDIWAKNKTKTTLDFFKNNPDFDGVFHDLELIDRKEIKPSYLNWKGISKTEILNAVDQKNLIALYLKYGSFSLGCSLTIKKTALEKYDLKNFTSSHDFLIVQKLSIKNKLGFIPEALAAYRLHPNQVYGLRNNGEEKEKPVLNDIQKYFNENVWFNLQIVEKHKELYPNENEKKTAFYATFIKERNSYLKKLNFFERKKYIAKCARYHYLDLQYIDLLKL